MVNYKYLYVNNIVNKMINMDNREIRGLAIISKGDTPIAINNQTYIVPSQSTDKKYKVEHIQEWTCDCPDFQHRRKICKHIYAIMFWLKFNSKTEIDDFLDKKVEENKQIKCIYCNSVNIIKKGIRKNKNGEKQRFLCKDCGKKFITDSIQKIKGNEKIVALIMDLYFRGFSLRDIKHHLKQFYNIDLTHVTIYRWIRRFTKIMNDYTNSKKIEPKEVWEVDEQAINSKGKLKWCWNIIDADTRFLLASQITDSRNIEDARKVFKKANEQSRFIPEFIITDGLWSYEKAIKKEFRFGTHHKVNYTKHVRIPSIRAGINNNLVERYHSTFREFDKVRRAFKGNEQDLDNGFRIYYNFIKNHEGLNGLTPSQAIGIDVNLGTNRWLDLLRESLEHEKSFKN